MSTTIGQRRHLASRHTYPCLALTRRYGSCEHTRKTPALPRPQRAVFAAYGDLPDAQERRRLRRRHPVLLEVLTSAGFLGVVAVQGYLVTRLGWPAFLVGLVSGLSWGLMLTFGLPSWLHTDLQVLRGHSRDELFPPAGHRPRQPAVTPPVARAGAHRECRSSLAGG